MRELNLGSVLRPTSGNLKCIPNSSVSDNKGIINEKKKTIDYKIKKARLLFLSISSPTL